MDRVARKPRMNTPEISGSLQKVVANSSRLKLQNENDDRSLQQPQGKHVRLKKKMISAEG